MSKLERKVHIKCATVTLIFSYSDSSLGCWYYDKCWHDFKICYSGYCTPSSCGVWVVLRVLIGWQVCVFERNQQFFRQHTLSMARPIKLLFYFYWNIGYNFDIRTNPFECLLQSPVKCVVNCTKFIKIFYLFLLTISNTYKLPCSCDKGCSAKILAKADILPDLS